MSQTDRMSAEEARAARETLGLSAKELALDLGLTPAVVESWESGSIRIPKAESQALRHRVAVHERTLALRSSGLPECAWVEEWERQLERTADDKLLDHLTRMEQHESGCSTCRARAEYLEARFPPLPPLRPRGWVGAVGWVIEQGERLPKWARTPAWMAAVFLAFTLFRGLMQGARLVADDQARETFLLALPITIGLGAAVGFAVDGYRWVRGRWRAFRASSGHAGSGEP